MTAQLLSSKLIIQEEPPSLRTIQGVATGIVACAGISSRGPIGVSTPCSSFEEFVKVFGPDTSAGISVSAVRGYFAGGGQRLYFTRVVHYTDITNPATKTSTAGSLTLQSSAAVASAAQLTGTVTGPFALTSGDTLVITRDAVTTPSTATFTGTAAALTSTGTGPFTLANNQTLLLRIDGGAIQTITFTIAQFVNITAATEAEVQSVINSTLSGASASQSTEGALVLTSGSQGLGSSIEITGGTAATALGLSTGTTTGTGNVVDISAVTIAEVKTIVQAAVTGVTVANSNGFVRIAAATVGPAGALQVQAASTAADELGLDTLAHTGSTGTPGPTLRVDAKSDGTYAASVTVLVLPATSGITSEFNLSVLYGGNIVEQFPNLTMLDTASRYVETILNSETEGSNYVSVADLQYSPGASGAPSERPANSPGSPPVAYGPLIGGTDGLNNIAEIDFIGDSSSRLGFHSFDLNYDPDLLICPEYATPAVHNAALSYTSVARNGEMFFIADPPAGLGPDAINQYVVSVAGIKNSTEFGAIYWPRVKVVNPNAALYGNVATIIVPASGHIAGMYARNDSARVGGVYLPPGGVERGQLPGVVGFENDSVQDERVRDLITPNLINPITRVRGWPIAVDDVLTLNSAGAFPTIAERRGVSFIERSLKDGLQFCRLRNNDATLRRAVYATVQAFLLSQMRSGAFRTQDPETAFFIDCSEAINPPSEQFAGRLHVRIGLATQKPARFIILSFAQDTRAIDQELAAAG